MHVEEGELEPEVLSLSIPVGLISEFRHGCNCNSSLNHPTRSNVLLRVLFRNFVWFVPWGILLRFLGLFCDIVLVCLLLYF